MILVNSEFIYLYLTIDYMVIISHEKNYGFTKLYRLYLTIDYGYHIPWTITIWLGCPQNDPAKQLTTLCCTSRSAPAKRSTARCQWLLRPQAVMAEMKPGQRLGHPGGEISGATSEMLVL